MYANL